jgi:hypothetical protein
MSAPATPTWGDIVNALIESAKEVLNSIANFVKDNAKVVAEAVIGVGLAYGVYKLVGRMFPQLRTVFGLFG